MRLAEMIFRSGRIGTRLYGRVLKLITVRNAIIHRAEPVVSQEIVETSVEVLQELRRAREGST